MTLIHLDKRGGGPPLLILHGWAMHGGVLRGFAERLADHYQTIVADLPGHGRSGALTPFELAAVGDALVAALPVRRFALLGWSLGGAIALDIAARYPERVEQLTLLASNPKFVGDGAWPGMRPAVLDGFAELLLADAKTTLQRFLALQVQGLPEQRLLLAQLRQAVADAPPPAEAALRGGLDILKTADLREQWRNLRCPASAIFGGRDMLVPVAAAKSLADLRPEAGVYCLDAAGHLPFLSHPDQVMALLRARQ